MATSRICLEALESIIYDIKTYGTERAFNDHNNELLEDHIVPAILDSTGIDMFCGIEHPDVMGWLQTQPMAISEQQAVAIADAVLALEID